MKYVIIGGGIAGISAAVAIREIDAKGSIDVFTESRVLPYYRPRLIEVLAEKITLDKIFIHPASFYTEKNITLHTESIIKIDNTRHELISEHNRIYLYDRLLLATGSYPFIPPIQGIEKNNVYTFRSQSDANNIKNIARKKQIVIIGGGLLGLETAYSLKLLGAKVTVVEFFNRLLPRQLDVEGAEFLKKKIELDGIHFRLNVETEAILGENTVAGIKLNSGESLPADAVIISAGVRARTKLAMQAGVSVNKGILVNNELETSIPHIYAAGDVAEYNHLLYGLWIPAKEQGTIAGNIMAGKTMQYTGSRLESRLKVSHISLFSFGPVDINDAKEEISKEKDSYTRLLIKNNQLLGAICIGDKKKIMLITKVLSGVVSLNSSGLRK